jgi:hypothetical protein
MTDREKLVQICNRGFVARGMDPADYEARLNDELREIDAQNEYGYFFEMHEKGHRWAGNENNLLIPYLLGAVGDYRPNDKPKYKYGEFPDIDTDYNPVVRDYLKNDWAPRYFGPEHVCSIGSYNSFGIKSALIDMARVHGKSRSEILELTTKLGLKDEDGKALTWDKALEEYPELRRYCEENPDVAEAAKRLLHRNRGMGMHAGGLIVSSIRLDDLVPLVKGKDNAQVSAWVEGLHGQDLGPMGLVKFDLLVITNLVQISRAVAMVKRRHGLSSFCALPGMRDWSDTSYLDDEKAIAMANRGDLKGIFQFDSEGIRSMVKMGGVTGFDDLVAYSSLYRPGPMAAKAHERYAMRKRGREAYDIHPLLRLVLEGTYGLMIYQEQCMQVLHLVGGIPLRDCEALRKAISKKDEKKFKSYKEKFIANGQVSLGWSAEELEELWRTVEAFSGYSFNKSVDQHTQVQAVGGARHIMDMKRGDRVYGVSENGETVEVEVVALHDHGVLDGYEVTFDDGHKVICTQDHKFLTPSGQMPLWRIQQTLSPVLCDPQDRGSDDADEEEGWLENTVRVDSRDWEDSGRTSVRVQGVPCVGMADECGLDRGTPSEVREGVPEVGGDDCPSTGVPSLRISEKREHSQADGQTRSREQDAGKTGNLLGDCEENIRTSGDSGGTSRATSQVARVQPGGIRQMYRSRLEESQAFEDGSLVAGATGLGDGSNSLRLGAETGGPRGGRGLDRGGRILPFQRTTIRQAEQAAGRGATAGCDVERGGGAAGDGDADPVQHGMFQVVERSDEGRVVPGTPGYAGIADAGRLVSRRVVRVVPVGKRQMYDLEIASPTHNYLLVNGAVTSNSHSCAYCYVSARLLYLKAHYPLEFFTAVLSCEGDTDKIKEYKVEAARHGVEVGPVTLNKSKAVFDIADGRIYYGFSNVKGIGPEVAARIVAGQPYAGFEDFLERFGTESNVVKPLLSLRVFDGDPLRLWLYYEYYRDATKKLADRRKRFEASQQKLRDELRAIVGEAGYKRFGGTLYGVELDDWKFQNEFPDEIDMREAYEKLVKLQKKWKRSVETNARKEEETVGGPPPFAQWEPDPGDWEVDAETDKLLCDREAGEKQYYGYLWTHPLEKSPDYKGGHTFEAFRLEIDGNNLFAMMCEVQVKSAEVRKSKSGKTTYLSLEVEDANSETARVNVWSEDMARFEPELQPGNLVKMRLQRPEPPYKTYTFESPPRHKRYLVPRDKSHDHRLVVMRRATAAAGAREMTTAELLDALPTMGMYDEQPEL